MIILLKHAAKPRSKAEKLMKEGKWTRTTITGMIVKGNHIFYHLIVSTATATYPIYIGKRLQNRYGVFFEKYPRIAIITNTTIYNIYKILLDNLSLKFPQIFHIVVGDGEEFKNITSLVNIFEKLKDNELGRDGLIIAFGGGVVGDLAGFASATYMRGIDFIQIPTTLLAMTDSSVGGKTGINLPQGKNIVGSFHQPQAVFCDLLFLDTLPVREFNSGLMEVIKYGLILDASLYDFIIQKRESIKKFDTNIVAYLIYRSCQLKAEIVAQDEKEKGIRSILNFGHTIGHALESYSDFKFYLHGEAVALGSLVIIKFLVDKGILTKQFLNGFIDLLTFFQLPTSIPIEFEIDQILKHLLYDKKKRHGRNQWILLKQVGEPIWGQFIDIKEIEKILRGLQYG